METLPKNVDWGSLILKFILKVFFYIGLMMQFKGQAFL